MIYIHCKNHSTYYSLTFLQLPELQSSHIELFHSTGAGVTRMQLAKVVIASVLVIAVCAEGLPEGSDCLLKCILV